MPRHKEKDYVLVQLSLSKDIFEYIDFARGNLSRTEFIEHIIDMYRKDFEATISELEKRISELEEENKKLREDLEAYKYLMNEVVAKDQRCVEVIREWLGEQEKRSKR